MKDRRTAAPDGRAAAPPRRGPSLSPDALKMPLAILGGLLILGAAGYYMIFTAFDTPMRIMLAAGILLIGIAVAIDPEAVWGAMTTRGALYGGNTLALAAIFLGILTLLNVLGARRAERWDLTANQRFSLSGETLNILQQVSQPIQVLGFFDVTDPRRREFEELLTEYQVRSNGQLSYQFIDPIENPAAAQQLGVRELGTSVLLMGDRQQQITGTREADLTTGILKLIQPNPTKAYFTVGHNEHSLDSFDPDGYSQLKTAMEARNFVVEPLNLFTTGQVPEDAEVVVVAGPKTPFADEERAAIDDYLNRGGDLLLLGDPNVDAGLNAFLTRWNVEIGRAYVVETDRNGFYRTPFNPVVNRFPQHPITEQMPPVLFPGTTYVNVPSGASPDAIITPLAQTSERSWAETDEAALRDPQAIRLDEGTDITGPLSLAVAIESRSATPPGGAPIEPDA
ncbi:MAG: GldG family protein, partial [Chloroflexota bacterium]|nr:GldG family protein [Chloroflexota bacterium]